LAIDPAGPCHAAALAAIHAASFPVAERWDAPAFATLLSQPGVFARIDPAGGLVLGRVAADEAEILTIAVAPKLRRQGRARALLAAAIGIAAAAGARALFLEVGAGNAAARALYAAAGLREVAERRNYYPRGETAIVLRADLIPCAAPES
jgi:ribosomal-protein-alanine N-acetyltransferase